MPTSKISTLSAVIVASLVLAGCNASQSPSQVDSGNDSGGTTDDQSTTTGNDLIGQTGTLELSGRVADGYLVGATVCLDLNESDTCDIGEPSATTTDGGHFTISGATDAQIRNGKILVIADKDTIDEDLLKDGGDGKVGSDFVLTSTPGKQGESQFISPLSTMVQTVMENNPGLSLQAARSSVADSVGLDPSDENKLLEDYVAAAKDTNDTRAAQLYLISQVTTRIQQQARESLTAKYQDGSGLNEAEFRRLARNIIQSYVDDRLPDLSSWASKHAWTISEVNDKATTEVKDILEASETTFAERQDRLSQATKSRVLLNNEAVLGDGLYFVYFEFDYESSTDIFGHSAVQIQDGIFSFPDFEAKIQDDGSWTQTYRDVYTSGDIRPYDLEGEYTSIEGKPYVHVDFSGGFGFSPYSVYADASSDDYTLNDDGTMTVVQTEYLYDETVVLEIITVDLSFRTQDVSGQPISWYVDRYVWGGYSSEEGSWNDLLTTEAVFPEGSALIRTSFGSEGGIELYSTDSKYKLYEDNAGILEPVHRSEVPTFADLSGLYLYGDNRIVKFPENLLVGDGVMDVYAKEYDSEGNRVLGSQDSTLGPIPYRIVNTEQGFDAIRFNADQALAIGLYVDLLAVVPGKPSEDYTVGGAELPEPINMLLMGSTPTYVTKRGDSVYSHDDFPALNPTAFNAIADLVDLPDNLRF